jgi:calcineurin-like phosphoesterase family protein
MYKKNDPSPKPIKAKVVQASDGSGITSGVTAYHITGTSRTTGSGSLTHIANGLWSYTPTQSETNYNEFAIEFYHADAVAGGPIVQVFTSSKLVSELNDIAKTDIVSDGVAFQGARIDAAISSRLATSDSRLNYLDASISSRLASNDSRLNYLDAAISSRADGAAYTSARATKLDNLDTTVSSRLAASSYTAPDNAGIAAIKSQTDKLTFNESNAVYAYGAGGASAAEVWSYSTRSLTDKSGFSLTSDYDAAKTAASQSTVDAIKAKTDRLQFTTDNDVKATLDGEKVTVQSNEDKTGYSLTTAYDAAKTAASQSSVDAIKSKTDQLTFNEASAVYAYGSTGGASAEEVWTYSNRSLTDKSGFALTSDYDAAKNAASQSTVNAIKSQTDKLQFTTENYVKAKAELVGDKTGYGLTSDYDRAKTALAVSEYTAPDNASIAAIKTQTDKLQFNAANDVKATLDGETVTVSTNQDKAGYSLTSDYDAAKTAASQSTVDAIKTKTDKLTFNESNAVYAYGAGGASAEEVWTYSNRSLTDKSNFSLTSDYDAAKNAAAQSTVDAIKAQTDKLQFTADNDVKATLAGEKVVVETNEDKTGYALTTAYDAAKTAASQTTVDAIKTKTDKLTFNAANAVYAYGSIGGASAEEVWTYYNRTLTDKSGFSLTSAYDAAKTAASQASVDALAAKIGEGTVINVISPLNPESLQLTLVRGDDYAAADGRALEWSSSDWPDLTDATVIFSAVPAKKSVSGKWSTTATVVHPGETTQIVRVELTTTQTASLDVGPNAYLYDIEATLVNGHRVTLATGKITVKPDMTWHT